MPILFFLPSQNEWQRRGMHYSTSAWWISLAPATAIGDFAIQRVESVESAGNIIVSESD
jgi:hypothetical protein